MGNEEGSLNHAFYNQDIFDNEIESISSEDERLEILYDRITKSQDNYHFSPIYVVPNRLREVNPSSFTPRVVSIGPLHQGHTNLKSMENKKGIYVAQLLNEVGSPQETFKNCMQMVTRSIETIRGYYSEMEREMYDDDQLSLMMVIDGCFILQFIRNLYQSGNLFSDNRLRSRNIALDLVLLENQIPFFVLQAIYDLTVKKLASRATFTTMLSVLLELVNPFTEPLRVEYFGREPPTPSHILGLLHEFYKPVGFKLPIISVIPRACSAVELDQVGVKIRRFQSRFMPMGIVFHSTSMFFWNRPTLRMPAVRVDDFFEVVLRNLIVYEQYSPVENHVTSYAIAMNMLAATPPDVARLGKSGVVISHLGSNEKASDMISSICKNVILQDFYYVKTWNSIVQHCDSYWPRNIGVFKRTYVGTLWKTIVLLAGIIVFFVTVVQFIFRIK